MNKFFLCILCLVAGIAGFNLGFIKGAIAVSENRYRCHVVNNEWMIGNWECAIVIVNSTPTKVWL